MAVLNILLRYGSKSLCSRQKEMSMFLYIFTISEKVSKKVVSVKYFSTFLSTTEFKKKKKGTEKVVPTKSKGMR